MAEVIPADFIHELHGNSIVCCGSGRTRIQWKNNA
jgi:hypothetical protein